MLVVCTGNICRSPMGEALLRAHLTARGVDARVESAGIMAWGGGATAHAVEVMRERGLDISGHSSRQLTADLVDQADIVLGMTRLHVGRVRRLADDAGSRAFLVGELVRLAGQTPLGGAEDPRAWVGRIAATRSDPAFVGRGTDEVDDPIGEPVEAYRATADRLDRELERLAHLLAP